MQSLHNNRFTTITIPTIAAAAATAAYLNCLVGKIESVLFISFVCVLARATFVLLFFGLGQAANYTLLSFVVSMKSQKWLDVTCSAASLAASIDRESIL